MITKPYFIGLDFGTSGVRVCLINDENETCYFKQHNSYDIRDPYSWRKVAFELVAQCAQQVPPESIRAIAIDGTSGTLLLTNHTGDILSDTILYNDDYSRLPSPKLKSSSLNNDHQQSLYTSLNKLAYLYTHYLNSPKKNQEKSLVIHQSDWVSAQFSGNYAVSDYNNCLKLGYEAEHLQWSNSISHYSFPISVLPTVVAPGTIIGNLKINVAKQLGLNLNTKVIAGTTDSTAAVWASGVRTVGEAMSSLGSTLAIKILSNTPVSSQAFGVYSHRYKNHYLIGGASNTGCAVLNKYFSTEEISRLSTTIDFTKPLNLRYYPLLKPGERFPINDSALLPQLEPRPTQPTLFLQALMEGITQIEKIAYEKLAQLGAPKCSRIISTGGGSNNEAWLALRQREIGVNIIKAEHQQAAYGSALIAKVHFET